MDSADLTREQGQALFDQTHKTLAYLFRLTRRMEQQRFPADDKLYVKAKAAYDSVFALNREAHHLSCRGQMGRQ